MHLLKLLFLLVPLAGLSACSVFPGWVASAPAQTQPTSGVVVPSAWSVTKPAAAAPEPVPVPPSLSATWWQGFGDAQLTALIQQALQANTSVRSAQAALLQSRALRDVKSAALGPSVNATGSAQRSQSANTSASNSFQAGFDASWEPDVFGARRSADVAAQADALAAQDSLAAVRVSLAAEVAVTYLDLRAQQARLGIAQGNLAAQLETLQLTRWRVQAGLASSLDQEQGVAASEQTAAQVPALQSSVAQSLHALAVLTGQVPGALGAAIEVPQAVPLPPAAWALSLPADTLRQRPDVRAAEQRISAALARVQQAGADRLPSFRISGSLGLRALSLGALTGSGAALGSLLASVSLPVLDGGAAQAQLRVQEAALLQARVAYEAAVLTALKDVEDALVSLQGNRDRLTRLQAAASAAANADLLARHRFDSGLIDYRVVLDAQRTLLSTQDSLESTRAALSADHVRLYKALGGGWTPEPL
ncbi:MAG: hypothetical protein RLZZ591_1522 [Pseudomonadota bacterium]|jgi:NodT family efflux transporter outer membrane factor (OMF) lipoprotein